MADGPDEVEDAEGAAKEREGGIWNVEVVAEEQVRELDSSWNENHLFFW